MPLNSIVPYRREHPALRVCDLATSGVTHARVAMPSPPSDLIGRARPVLLVVGGLPAHKARSVSAYVQSRMGRLDLHFLPPYAPDLNPDEFVGRHVKQNGVPKRSLRENASLVDRANADLEYIEHRKPLVRSFFKADSVSYTAY